MRGIAVNDASNLCIIGQEKSESSLKLLEEAKKRFDTVFFVPINAIGIGLKDKFSISYRATDLLKFKAIFPRIPREYCSYAYQLLSLFPPDTYMPIKPISFLLADERFFLLTVLRKRGINTINLHMTRSSEAASRIIEQLQYPLVVRTSEKKTGVVVNNKTEAKSITGALASLNRPILIEDLVDNLISVYVARNEVIGSVKKKTKEKDIVFSKGEFKSQKINLETKQLALDAVTAIDAQVARVDLTIAKEPEVVDIDLNPGLIYPSTVLAANLPEKLMEAVHAGYESHKQKPLLMKFFEDAKSVVKDVLGTKQLL